MSKEPYTLQELKDLAQSVHDRGIQEDLGIFMSILNTAGDQVGVCLGKNLDNDAIVNIIAQMVDRFGSLPVFAAMVIGMTDGPVVTRVKPQSEDPLDAEVVEV